MRAILCGGGTGGHINPAIAIAKKICKEEPGSEILFCGGVGGLEERLVPREGFRLETFDIKGFRRKLDPKSVLYNFKVLKKAVASQSKAKKVIRDFKPDIVIGCGGYASYPVMKQAQSMKVPTAVLEVNVLPGVTTKVLAAHADLMMLGFTETKKYFDSFKGKMLVTGNPIRADILDADREAARKELGLDGRPLIVSVWGSLGAEQMNRQMADFIALEAKEDRHHLIHAIGGHGYAWLPDLIASKGVDLSKHQNIEVRDYIYDMARVLAAADLVLCRAGAATLAELAVIGKPCIIVPSPNVAENHQEKNARALEQAGGAVVILEKDSTGELLYKEACRLLASPDTLVKMSENMKKRGQADAIDQIYTALKSILPA